MARCFDKAMLGDDQEHLESAKSSSRTSNYVSRRLLLSLFAGLATLTLFVFTAGKLSTDTSVSVPITSTPMWTDCGGSPSEARRRGCHFDILSFAWQTLECYDRENTEAFRKHSTWSYYKTQAGPRQISEEKVLEGGSRAFVTGEYHFVHCTYMWRQLHRAYTLFGYIDEHLDNWNHTLHCQGVLLKGINATTSIDVNTVGRVIYPKCRRIW